MTEAEVYEMVSEGGATDFAQAIGICRRHGPFCLIGGLAVNCYVAPIFTMDADFVLATAELPAVAGELHTAGFSIEEFPHSSNATMSGSKLVLQFTKDSRYQDFLERALLKNVLGLDVPVAAPDDLIRGKTWAWSDPQRRLTKRKKDELDLLRLGEGFPQWRHLLPAEIVRQIEEAR